MPLIYFAIWAGFLNMFLQLPLNPLFARSLTSDLSLVALAVSAYSISNLAGNLLAGLVVDRFPKGLVLSAGLGLGAAALIACGWVSDVRGLVAMLLVNGAALSVVTPAAYALLSEHLPAMVRAQGMARSGAAIGLAALVGPPVGGRLADVLGFSSAYQAIGIGMLAVAVIVFAAFRKDRGRDEQDVGLADLWRTALDPRLRVGYIGAFALMFANGGLVFALPPYIKGLGYSASMVGALFSTFALAGLIVFLSPLGKVISRMRPVVVLAIGGALMAAGLAALAGFHALPPLVAVMCLYGVGFGLVFVGSLTAVVAEAPETKRGTAFGVFYAVFSAGAIAGPFVLAHAGTFGLSPFVLGALVPVLLSAGMLLHVRLLPRTAAG